MAENEINGRDILIQIDPAGGTSYKTVVCLTSNTMTQSLSELDASSKCGDKFLPGQKFEATISGEGFVVDPDTGTPTNQGFTELYDLFENRVVVSVRFGVASPTTGEAVYTGDAFIQQLEVVAPDDDLTTFSVTFRCTNPPFTQTVTY